jgi:hypothetical protein
MIAVRLSGVTSADGGFRVDRAVDGIETLVSVRGNFATLRS